MYLPVSEDYTKFVGVSGSKEGIVIPILIEGTQNNFHVTVFIKENEKDYYFDAHLTDQSSNRHIPLFSATITKEEMSAFGKKCEKVGQAMIPILNKYTFPIETINRQELCCIDCLFAANKLPSKYSTAKEFWKTLNKHTDIELINKHANCVNKNHKMYYDKDKKTLICFTHNGRYIGIKNINSFMKDFETVLSEFFDEELVMLQETVDSAVAKVKETIKE